ncbi:NUDIX domain-containing protein [Denitrobaculum tricleocarpae]|uniref:ADP-ribose pyrophosphatase n=1 Tax=Denitrobaculum tricleocarpae TaxID=2591009 RepID=A0A545TQ47_9PROT|nr:NUDIX domain-containing protein [Denitrobaculum tricleocarpae]TQV79339.1 NUDIX domain-containing protein [Denitrobaculum tricleocarpae]
MNHDAHADPTRQTELVSKSTLFKRYFQVDEYVVRHSLFAGGVSEPVTREVFERGHAAAVIPYDPEADAIVFIEQFRTGAFAAGLHPWLIEVVAGIIDDGESPAEVARREAMEEANCKIGELVPIGKFLVSPGGSSETLSLFCGRVQSATIGGIHGLSEESEDIRAFVLSFEDALTQMREGKITNLFTFAALQWLVLNREELRAKWQ